LELWKIADELSVFFDKNIIVYKDVKDLKISCNLRNLSLEKSLDVISWIAGQEWYFKENNYYIGGNKDFIAVIDNTGIDSQALASFGQSVKACEDKIIVTGTEREVKRICLALEQLQKRSYIMVRIWGYEISDAADLKFGFNIDKALKYSASWENLIANSYNPIQSLVMSIDASLEADKSSDGMHQILNTTITCISGKKQSLIVGEAVDRALYQAAGQSGNVYQSSFSTQQTGFTLNLAAFRYEKDWIFNVSVENSVATSDTRRNNVRIENTVVASPSPALVGRMIKELSGITVTTGIPWLCDIPYLGYLFRVTTEHSEKRNIIFFMQTVATKQGEELAPEPRRPCLPMQDLNIISLFNQK